MAILNNRIMLTGFMGTGKTTIGQMVAQRLGWRFADSDDEVVNTTGMSIARLFAQQGEAAFRQIEREIVRRLADEDNIVVATGGGALMNDETRVYVLARALVVCLNATPETLALRLSGDRERPLLKGDWRALLESRRPVYAALPFQIDTTGRAPEQVAEEVLALWQNAST